MAVDLHGKVAYHHYPGVNRPGVIFLPGFRSAMTGRKALELEDYCRSTNREYIRFDYRGHGQSLGSAADFVVGDWIQDALAVSRQYFIWPSDRCRRFDGCVDCRAPS